MVATSFKSKLTVTVPPDSAVSIPVEPAIVTVSPLSTTVEPVSPAIVKLSINPLVAASQMLL